MEQTDLMSAVQLMGRGMLAILLVIAAIAVIVYLFTRFSKR